jgi:hypothetical protein
MVTWRDCVALSYAARDLHTPGVFLPALARAGYGLFFQLRKMPIWTSDGRPSMGRFPETTCVLHVLVVPAVCFLCLFS